LDELFLSLQLLILVVYDPLECLNRLLGGLRKPLAFLLEEMLALFLIGDEFISIVSEHATCEFGL
jgi:hypothetical protein